MRNLEKENNWKKRVYKHINMSFRKDTESELLATLEKQAKSQNLTLTEYCKKIIIKSVDNTLSV